MVGSVHESTPRPSFPPSLPSFLMPPFRHSRCFPSVILAVPSVISDASSVIPDDPRPSFLMPRPSFPPPPSVIPDVFNRESRIFPRQRHTNEGTKERLDSR